MGWPFEFAQLTAEQQHESRVLLDQYGMYGQISAFSLIAFLLLIRLSQWLIEIVTANGTIYDAVPTSEEKRQASARLLSPKLRRVLWWLDYDVKVAGLNLGRRDELLFGVGWTAWLLFLCINQTGKDYIHFARRLAAVGASQFPVQYVLALKCINPVAFALRTSHERINRWHRVLGCIIYVFVALHSLLYLNYYIQVGELSHALFRLVPALGMATLFVMTVLYTTAWSIVRKYSYRVFYITHIIVALAAPPLVWFHVYHARLFMGESLLLFVVDLVVRKLRIIDSEAVIEIIPGTDLIKVIATVPSEKLRLFRAHPASYAYLSIPSASRPSQKQWSLASLRYTFTSNPFTVATVDEERSELTLVARQMRGPVTTALARLASMRSPDSKVALRVDGPYGATMHLPVLSGNRFDRVLLVAGGVGATFIMPLYEHVLAESASARVQMIWAVRDSDELRWPAPSGGKTIHDDDRIQLFVTGAPREDTSTDVDGSTLDGLDDDIELNRFELEGKTAAEARAENCRRPDLQVIVDEVFCQGAGERVAVLVCGPTNMARHVQKAVGKWVTQGRDVWFYNESYSW